MKKLKNLQTNETISFEHAKWIDEGEPMVVESIRRSLSGAAHISVGKKLKGRPITLKANGKADFWLKHAEFKKIEAWANVVKLKMLYTHDDGRAFTVKFRHRDGALRSKKPLVTPTPDDAWHKNVEIYLETV